MTHLRFIIPPLKAGCYRKLWIHKRKRKPKLYEESLAAAGNSSFNDLWQPPPISGTRAHFCHYRRFCIRTFRLPFVVLYSRLCSLTAPDCDRLFMCSSPICLYRHISLSHLCSVWQIEHTEPLIHHHTPLRRAFTTCTHTTAPCRHPVHTPPSFAGTPRALHYTTHTHCHTHLPGSAHAPHTPTTHTTFAYTSHTAHYTAPYLPACHFPMLPCIHTWKRVGEHAPHFRAAHHATATPLPHAFPPGTCPGAFLRAPRWRVLLYHQCKRTCHSEEAERNVTWRDGGRGDFPCWWRYRRRTPFV